MSTSAVNSTSLNQLLQQYFQTRGSDLKQLGQALKSGDLAGAQTAYTNIVALGQKGPFAGGDPFKINQREQDFAGVGQALQAGDLAGAQQAFGSLISTFKARPLDPPPPSSTGPAVVLNLGNSGGAPTGPSSGPITSGPEIVLNIGPGNSGGSSGPEQITLNIASAANGGEQISLSVGSQGSSPEQIQFNLPANSNEQIVLNLLGASSPSATSTASSSSSTSGGLSVSA
jgi:hypothetical protein